MAFSYYGYELIRESDLAHYGVLGMKWGIRRFQNKDGSYTDQGRKRYSARDYSRQLNTLDTQTVQAIYERENANARFNDLTRKAMKKASSKNGMSEKSAKKFLNKKDRLMKAYELSDERVKHGEELTNKVLASALERGYSIESKKVQRMADNGYKAMSSALGFTFGIMGVIPAVAITSIDTSIKAKRGWNNEAMGMVEGNKFKVKKTPEGQRPYLRTQLHAGLGYLEAEAPTIDEEKRRKS